MENKISWQALEYKRKDKTADWYWAVGLIALSIVIISFITHNVFFAVLVIISTAILLSFSITAPRMLNISINQKGLAVEKDLYPFATLESFWVEGKDEDNQKILFKSKKILMPLIMVPLEEHHHLDVREFLLQYLPEVEMHESTSKKIMEKLGF
ncbi:MAG: hypothetical protein WC933_01210 [Candidatus Paceibacterota bacterium]|jgi:hypothetical protein